MKRKTEKRGRFSPKLERKDIVDEKKNSRLKKGGGRANKLWEGGRGIKETKWAGAAEKGRNCSSSWRVKRGK